MFLNHNRLLLSKRIIKYVESRIFSNPEIIRFNKGALSFILVSKRCHSDKADETGQDASYSRHCNFSTSARNGKTFGFNSKSNNSSQSNSKNQDSLTDEVKLEFEASKSDVNSFGSTTVTSINVIKKINQIISKKKWTASDKDKFISSDEFNIMQKEILLHQEKMDPFTLKEIVTFLEVLGFSKDNYLPLKMVYSTMEKKMGVENIHTVNVMYKETIREKPAKPEISDVLKKLRRALVTNIPDNEMNKILQEASNIKMKDMTPIFLMNYLKLLDKVDIKNLCSKDVTLKFGLFDSITYLVHQYEREFVRELPVIFFTYAKTVISGKLTYSESTVDFILENIRKEKTIGPDQNFTALKALNMLQDPQKDYKYDYLRHVVKSHVNENPESLESMENLDVLLQGLRISNFQLKHESQWDEVKSIIMKRLSVLEDEEKWKTFDLSQLKRIAENSAALFISPSISSRYNMDHALKENSTSKGELHECASNTEFANETDSVSHVRNSSLDLVEKNEIKETAENQTLTELDGQKLTSFSDKRESVCLGNLFNYTKSVVDGETEYSKETVNSILEEFKTDKTVNADGHFLALEALNVMARSEDEYNLKYLRYIIMNHVIRNPQVLESVKNLDVFLTALQISNFHLKYQNQGNYVNSVLTGLSILKDEEKWKNADQNQLQRIAQNLSSFGICSDILSSFADRTSTSDELLDLNSISQNLSVQSSDKSAKNNEIKFSDNKPDLNSYQHDFEFKVSDGNQYDNDDNNNNLATKENSESSVNSEPSSGTIKEGKPNMKVGLVNVLKNLESSPETDYSLSGHEKLKILMEDLNSNFVVPRITSSSLLDYYELLDKINYDHPILKSTELVRKMYAYQFKCIEEKNEHFVQQIPSILSIYAKIVADGKITFYQAFVNANVSALIDNEKLTVEKHLFVLESLNNLKTYNAGYVRHVVKHILENSSILEESIEKLGTFLEALGACDFPSKFNKKWPYLKSFIQKLSILENEDKWRDAELSHLVNVTKNLALFGIYSNDLLSYVSEKVNEKPLEDPKLWSTLLVLNQAVDTLHPSFTKCFLSNESLETISKEYSENDTSLKEVNSFAEDVKFTLELETYERDVFLTNCYTKLGIKIDLVFALNESDQPFSFTSFLEKPRSKCFIDEIFLPDNYELIVICLFDKENILRSKWTLDSAAQLKLKTLEAMGYTVIPILKRQWLDIEKENRGSHFWKKIIDDSKCNIPEELLEKLREPIFMD